MGEMGVEGRLLVGVGEGEVEVFEFFPGGGSGRFEREGREEGGVCWVWDVGERLKIMQPQLSILGVNILRAPPAEMFLTLAAVVTGALLAALAADYHQSGAFADVEFLHFSLVNGSFD